MISVYKVQKQAQSYIVTSQERALLLEGNRQNWLAGAWKDLCAGDTLFLNLTVIT